MSRFLAGWTVQAAIFSVLVMGPAWAIAGDLQWQRGWLALGILVVVSGAGGLWVLWTNPALVRERTTPQAPRTAADGVATVVIALTVAGWFIVAAWDAHRVHVLPLAGPVSLGAGLALFLAGLGVILWTFRVNTFAATIVKVQREQRVIETGPYAFVRHPMYSGTILFFGGLGLILGSTAAALLSLPCFVLALTPRIRIEEAVLRRELAGYERYQARVRARLIPGVV